MSVLEWLLARANRDESTVEPIPFAELSDWHQDPATGNLCHASGRFFSVVGASCRVQSDARSNHWEQPLINQPEHGLLGLLSRTVAGTRQFLMQAKMEPGNINRIQLSPTVQATMSNFTRVHAGRPTEYLDYFAAGRPSRVLADSLQSEQGGRFYQKRNRNVVIELNQEIPVRESHRWVSEHELMALLREDNLVNMNSRSVLACYLASQEADDTGMPAITQWIAQVRQQNQSETRMIPLSKVSGWRVGEREIRSLSKDYFSVIAVAVHSDSREVAAWTQPILKESGPGFIGVLVRRVDGLDHYLLQAKLEPGNIDSVYIGPTVQCSHANIDPHLSHMSLFTNARGKGARYEATLSEEGGRFYHNQNLYMAVEVDHDIELSENHRWVSYPQVQELIRRGLVNVEARTLIAATKLGGQQREH